jgi:hypothetical protein
MYESLSQSSHVCQDSSSSGSATTTLRARSIASAMDVVTVGQLVHEDDDVVVLGLSVDEPGDAVFGAQVIWKRSIIERSCLASLADPPELA